MSLEQTIRKLGVKGTSQPLEKDMNDQVHAGSYSSKHFEVSAPAQKLYASLPKDVDPDKAERSVQLHDKLFAMHKKTSASERSTTVDQEEAQRLHDEIMSLAKEMGLEDKHGHVKDSLEHIKKYVDTQTNVKDDIKPEDVAKRYATPPKDYQNDVKADADIDNLARFKITRDKKGQRKLKIIDDEFNLGVEKMDRIEKVSVSFLEALKQVKSNAEALEEKKKMTKADIAALKEPKGKFDEKDLAALRNKEHLKKKVEEEVEQIDEMEDDDGWYSHKEMHGSKAVSKEDWKKGYRLNAKGEKVKKSNEEVEQVDESLNAAHKTAITKHVKKMWGKGEISFDKQDGNHFVSHSDGIQTHVHSINMKKGVPHVTHFMSMDESVEQIDEAQFIVIQKGMEKKRIRNNPVDVMKARKDGWAIQEETETVEEGSEMKNLAKSQKAATIKREVQQKKQIFAKKDATDKAEHAKSMQKEEFMERAIAILGENFKDATFEELKEEIVKKARGRPRKNPLPDPNAPKRPRGRPKKGSGPVSTSTPAKPGAAKPADTDKDREHIVMALRKSISLRGEHGVKFADGSTHKVPAEHAQKALKMHDSLSKPSEKMVFQRKLAASHSSFKKALEDKNPGSEETKKTGITLAKRAEF